MSVNASVLTAPALRGDNTFTGVNTFSGAVSMSSTTATPGAVTPTPTAGTSGVRTALTVTGAADTGLTASTEQLDVYLNLGRTLTWATGALTTQRAFRIAAPTLAFAGASTVTPAATFYIDAAPTAGANATITNAYAMWVDAGTTRLDGTLLLNGAITADATDASGTPGAATINKAVGKAAIALGAASVVITNSLVSAGSIVLVTAIDQDATAVNLSVLAGAGSFTVSGAAAATAATAFSFIVIN